MGIKYLSLELAKEIHLETIIVSGGGASGILNEPQLASVLDHIQNDDYYPQIQDKLTHLFFSVCKFHCFQDGNKRAAITFATHMLILNGLESSAERFLREMENISHYVAKSAINKELLLEIITDLLYADEISESVKLKLLNAMQDSD